MKGFLAHRAAATCMSPLARGATALVLKQGLAAALVAGTASTVLVAGATFGESLRRGSTWRSVAGSQLARATS